MEITLDISVLTALYPYVVLLDKDSKISWASPLMIKALTFDPKGREVSAILKLPDSCGSVKELAAYCNQIIPLRILTDNCCLPLRAVCLCSDSAEIRGIAGLPDIAYIERIEDFNLTIDDFSPDDPLIDILLLRSELETSKKDLHEAVNKLRQKQSELQTAEFYRLQLSEKLKELKEQRAAMLNMLEDIEASRAELRDINAGLEDRIRDEINRRLEKEQLLIQQSRLAAMGEMIGAIAHQWRQPLNAVGLIIQDFKDAYEYGELDKKYLEKNTQKGMEIIKSMSRTIDDFRNFFRPDKEKTEFDVKESISNVLRMLSAQLKAHSISFKVTCHVHNKVFEKIEDITSCGEHKIVGYKNEFEHVIMNLINNAKDAFETESEARGETMRQQLIDIDIDKEGDRVIVTVKDNAGGIPEEIIDRIFEPYFTTKEQGKGTGIGLYMSKAIIENNMGGSISVQNVGNGAEFRIELPVTPPPPENSQINQWVSYKGE